MLVGVLLPNCELVDDLLSLLLVDDSSNVNDQMRFRYCLMNERLLNARHWIVYCLIEMMTAFRVNVFRDANFLNHSWCPNHYCFHSAEFIEWRFSMSNNVRVNLAYRCRNFC